MKGLSKLPLYLGFGIFILAVMISVVTVSNRRSVTSTQTRANTQGALLTLQDVSDNVVSVLVASEREVAGIDVVVSYDASEVTVIPASLLSGPSFITAGGIADDQAGTFSFSAIPKEDSVTSSIVATFALKPIDEENTQSFETNLQFVLADEKTAVIEADTGDNILLEVSGVTITVQP